MSYQFARPSAGLSHLVKQYWGLENCLPSGMEHVQRIVPNGLPQLIFYLDDIPVSDDPDLSTGGRSLITGMLNRYYDIRVRGRMTLFAIIFRPDAITGLFNIPAPELTNRNVPLSFLLKGVVSEIEDRLGRSVNFTNRVRIIEDFLMRLLIRSSLKENRIRIGKSIPVINSGGGTASVDYLASHACFSRKQYERMFTENIGLTPKQFMRVVRFQYAIYRRSADKNLTLTSLAYECGYYDQSHMINEFREFSGVAPREFFASCEAMSDYFD